MSSINIENLRFQVHLVQHNNTMNCFGFPTREAAEGYIHDLYADPQISSNIKGIGRNYPSET